jgi:hypothetical protein
MEWENVDIHAWGMVVDLDHGDMVMVSDDVKASENRLVGVCRYMGISSASDIVEEVYETENGIVIYSDVARVSDIGVVMASGTSAEGPLENGFLSESSPFSDPENLGDCIALLT